MCDSSCDSSSNSGIVNSLLCLTATINPALSPMSSTSSKEEMHEASSISTAKGDGAAAPGAKQNQVGTVMLFGVPIVSLVMDGKERLCLAQISSTLLKEFSYNEIHNRRVALGINCVQCTPVQLEILRRAGAMPVTSRRCGMITRREAERLCKSFLGDHAPPQLPENFAFDVYHECGWGCRGSFVPSRYNSSRAKCIRCSFCQLFFSPNKFIFHSHRLPESRYVQPDAANFNSWRRHMKLCGDPPEEAMFNGGTRKRLLAASTTPSSSSNHTSRQSSSTSHGGSSGSGSVKSSHGHNSHNHGGSGRCQPRGDSQNNTNNSNNSGSHSRLGGGSQAKNSKESSSSSVSVTSSSSMASAAAAAAAAAAATASGNLTMQHAPNAAYNNNHDAPHAGNFLHQPSQNPFLNVHNPLLSPSGRLDAIWNPALPGPMAAAAAAAAAANIAGQQSGSTRQCPIPNSPPFPALPFHPLSIPWLRRPLFPFSHPFGPTLINDAASGGGSTTTPEKLVNLARQNQSAFKPVSRSAEPLFNWLNGNIGVGGGAPGNALTTLGQCSVVGSITTLPEDLSLNSSSGGGGHAAALNVSNNGNSPQITGGNPNFSNTVAHASEKHHHRYHNSNNNNNNNSMSSKHHQIQILSTNHNDSDDEENVDIESTVETEECSSTSSVWVSSTTAVGRSGGGGGGDMMLNNNNNNSVNNNNNNNKIQGFARRKRLATTAAISCYSSGDEDVTDERDRDSDNHDDNSSTMDHYEETLRTSGERGNSKSGKRKRLWVNEIISTTDDDDDGNNKQGKR